MNECGDFYSQSLQYSKYPKGPNEGTYCVLRGGSVDNAATRCRLTSLTISNPLDRLYTVGFRVSMSK